MPEFTLITLALSVVGTLDKLNIFASYVKLLIRIICEY